VGASVGGENIAIGIQTSADNSGIAETRSGLNELASAATSATTEIAAATNEATNAENQFSAAVAEAAAAGRDFNVTQDQMRAALTETNGNHIAAVQLLREQATAQHEAALAAQQQTAALEEEAAAATQVVAAADQEIAAERQVAAADRATTIATEELIVATEQKDAAMAGANAQMGRIPAQARTAANSLSVLTQAAVAGKGGISGIANAAGGLAFGLAALVPELALAAYGIGALVTVGTLLYEVWEKDAEKRERLNAAIAKSLAQDPALEAYIKAQEEASKLSATIADETAAATDRATLSSDEAAARAVQRAAQRRIEEIRQLKITEGEKTTLIVAEERDRDAQLDAIAAQRQRQDEQRARSLDATMQEETQAAIDRRTLTEEGAAEAQVVREERRREEEIRALQINEDEKTRLILEAQADRDARLAEIAKQAADKRAEQEKRDADRAAEEFRRIVLSGVNAAITSSESYVQAVTRALLTPIVNYLESVAESQIVDAAAEAAFGNFVGAAQHAGVAALAIAGARKVASIGGLNSSGGGSSAGAYSGGGGGSTFTPSTTAQGQGGTVVNLYTLNPYSGEAINRVSYLLQRNGVLNQPIYVPATNGLYGVPD
jgi:hypothetical protein